MNTRTILLIVVLALFLMDLIREMMMKKKREKLLDQMMQALAQGDYDAFDELAASEEARRLIPLYNISFMKLNEALMKNDPEQIEEALGSFKGRMNDAQKDALYRKAFYYYVSVKDKEKAKEYYDLLKDLNTGNRTPLDVMYNTYIEEGSMYLDRTLEEIDKLTTEEEKLPYYALICDMYTNAGDTDKAKEYEELVNRLTQEGDH